MQRWEAAMIVSSNGQKIMEARVAVFRNTFLMMLNCQYLGRIGEVELFYDLVTEHLIGIPAGELCKAKLIDNINFVRHGQQTQENNHHG